MTSCCSSRPDRAGSAERARRSHGASAGPFALRVPRTASRPYRPSSPGSRQSFPGPMPAQGGGERKRRLPALRSFPDQHPLQQRRRGRGGSGSHSPRELHISTTPAGRIARAPYRPAGRTASGPVSSECSQPIGTVCVENRRPLTLAAAASGSSPRSAAAPITATQRRPIDLRGAAEMPRPRFHQTRRIVGDQRVARFIQPAPACAPVHLQQLVRPHLALEIAGQIRSARDRRPSAWRN